MRGGNKEQGRAVKPVKIFNFFFDFSSCRVLVKALHVKITEDVCHYTRKTVMCASAVMGSLEFTVNKVNNYDKTHLSCLVIR